jgi:hypothetical protein
MAVKEEEVRCLPGQGLWEKELPGQGLKEM